MVMSDISARPAEMRLTERAVDFLAAGPADVVALIGHICQLPNPPRVVAEHMAAALFAGRTEFSQNETGHWELRRGNPGGENRHAAAAASMAPVTLPDELPAVKPGPRGRAAIVAEPRPGYPTAGRAARRPPIDPGTAGWHTSPTGGDPGQPLPYDGADLLASLSYVVVDV